VNKCFSLVERLGQHLTKVHKIPKNSKKYLELIICSEARHHEDSTSEEEVPRVSRRATLAQNRLNHMAQAAATETEFTSSSISNDTGSQAAATLNSELHDERAAEHAKMKSEIRRLQREIAEMERTGRGFSRKFNFKYTRCTNISNIY